MTTRNAARAVLLGGTVLAGASAGATTFQHVIVLSVDGLHEADLTDPATR